MSMQHDPDLDDVLQDQELRHVADLLREARMTEAPLDDAFRSALRRQLMNQAWGMGGGGTPWWRKVFGPTGMVWATAAVGVILIGVVVVLTATNQPGPSDQVVVTSPISNQSAVRLQQPIQVTFNQPMNHPSTEAAVQITPATTVAFSWHENTLSVTPTAGDLAPNTQYQVTIGPGARTASGQSLTAPKTITFVTQPPAAPSPSPSPSARPTPVTALAGQHLLASIPEGITNVLWSPDSSTVYFVTGKGALESVPFAGGSPTVIAPDGVTSVAINPAGDQLAYIRKANIEILAIAPGTTTEVVPTPAPVLVGWTTGGVEWVSADGVYTAAPGGQGKVAPLPATGTVTAISFAPDGVHLAYTQDQSLNVMDLGTGKSTVLGLPGAHFLGWSPDGTGIMYSGAQAVELVLAGRGAPGQRRQPLRDAVRRIGPDQARGRDFPPARLGAERHRLHLLPGRRAVCSISARTGASGDRTARRCHVGRKRIHEGPQRQPRPRERLPGRQRQKGILERDRRPEPTGDG